MIRNVGRLFMVLAVAGLAVSVGGLARWAAGEPSAGYSSVEDQPGVVRCANLIYGHSKTSVCFSDEFLAQVQKDSNIRTNRRFFPVKLDSAELYDFPFAVMTGEGSFSLTAAQRTNLRNYLARGGFLVASAGCSSNEWDASFRAEIRTTFPELQLVKLDMSHPLFHTIYSIDRLATKRATQSYLECLTMDGRIVLAYSHDGLNDTGNAGPGCCCCGGNEILNARQVNANLLAYALTH